VAEAYWPSDADLKRIVPKMDAKQIRRAGDRMLESAETVREFIEELDRTSHLTEEDMSARCD